MDQGRENKSANEEVMREFDLARQDILAALNYASKPLADE